MPSTTITTSTEDGYINDNGGTQTTFKAGNDIVVDTSSSSNAVTDTGYWFFNTINDGSATLPAGAIIDSVSFTCHMNTSSPGANFTGLTFYICNNACIGSTLENADEHVLSAGAGRNFAIESGPGVQDFTYPLLTTDINLSGYTNIEVDSIAGDVNFGEVFKYDAVEKAGGTPGRLNITYHLPSTAKGSTLQMMGLG